MSKWFEVEITAFKTVVVEMEDDATIEEAEHYAQCEVTFYSDDITETNTTELKTELQIDVAKRHADQLEAL